MRLLRIESGNRVTIPDDVIRTLRLSPGDRIEVRFPQVFTPARGLGTATQWQHLSNKRLKDAEVLLQSRRCRYSGAVYLGGYAVECALKSAICVLKNLPQLPEEHRTHNLEVLLRATGLTLPDRVVHKFAVVNRWAVNIRYLTKTWNARDAREFLGNVKEIKQWIGREISTR